MNTTEPRVGDLVEISRDQLPRVTLWKFEDHTPPCKWVVANVRTHPLENQGEMQITLAPLVYPSDWVQAHDAEFLTDLLSYASFRKLPTVAEVEFDSHSQDYFLILRGSPGERTTILVPWGSPQSCEGWRPVDSAGEFVSSRMSRARFTGPDEPMDPVNIDIPSKILDLLLENLTYQG